MNSVGIDRCFVRVHGGPDAAGAVRWDFSTNVNAAGPCPHAVEAMNKADATRYPDPAYTALRERIAHFHQVEPLRIVPGASASELIQRFTVVGGRIAPGPVSLPAMAYGDYAFAARACGRAVTDHDDSTATLRWCCEPSSPLGQDADPPSDPSDPTTVLDLAYAPLRLRGASRWSSAAMDGVFRLFSPNKALGLPGVRGAYAIAPRRSVWSGDDWCRAMAEAAPSWPLGAHAVALLEAWTDADAQTWLETRMSTLRKWTVDLRTGLDALGLQPLPSVTPFMCARLPAHATRARLRERGLAVRDTTSFGLPGHMRVSAQPPEALSALLTALDELKAPHDSDS